MFRKVLIANRGEIAVRISKTLQQMGVRAVAVYSDIDRDAPHVSCADEAYRLSGTTAAETYLNVDRIIEIAKKAKAEAIHPGYGFLSENAAFAEACAQAGLTFIGPTPDVIREMGDKIAAKRRMEAAGVPVIPGWSGDANAKAKDVQRAADGIGYPLMVKAAAGGGGKGMRLVESSGELVAAVEAASREAKAAFADGRIFLEKYLARPRHIEFQIFGDSTGRVVHLFERECSIQRRHQKIIEESPSPALTPELRERMGAAAVAAGKAMGYTNAGTVEMLLDANGDFYFLEVNTRLQVEHPVTECITHRDLVRLQLDVAAGRPLPDELETLQPDGHAVECRVYAEDPQRGFLPSTGVIGCYRPPAGPNVRVDSGVEAGSEVTVHYDPMLAKLITTGRSREDALRRMAWALDRYVVLGVSTNIEFLRRVIDHPDFVAGKTHTHFLDEHDLAAAPPADAKTDRLALLAAAWHVANHRSAPGATAARTAAAASPWNEGGYWRAF